MSIYGDQVGRRVRNDDARIENSLKRLGNAVTGRSPDRMDESGALEENRRQIALLFAFFHLEAPDPEDPANSRMTPDRLVEELTARTRVMKRRVRLEESWWVDGYGPMLAVARGTNRIVALLPENRGGYCFYAPGSDMKTRVTRKNQDLFEPDAWCFYKPLPDEPITKKGFLRLIRKECSLWDALYIVIAAAAIAGVNALVPYATKYAYNHLVPSGKTLLLLPLAVMLVSAAVGSWLFSAVRLSVTERIQTKLDIRFQNAVFSRVLNLPVSFFQDQSSGGLARRVAALISVPGLLCDIVFGGVLTLAVSAIYLFQILTIADVLALPALLIFAAMIAFYVVTILQEQKKIRLKLEAEERNHGVTYDLISGIQKIKVSGSEKRVFARWLEGYALQAKADYTIYVPLAFRDQILTTISCIGTLVLYLIAYSNKLSVAQLTAFTSAYGLVCGSVSAMGSIGTSFSNLKPALKMGESILAAEPEHARSLTKVRRVNGMIEFNDVSFRYEPDSPLILDRVSLSIRPGEYVALVGKSGCGKSTVMKLLLGFKQPVQGTISMDGMDIGAVDMRSLRSHIGTVLQSGKLFAGDILSNITIADSGLTEEDAWAAAEKAGIAEDIRRMPMGMHTRIGENGEGISGGQKQRILIARAIAPNPGLLLFDEATSALDNISQSIVTHTLSKQKGTRIVIAHRLSTIRECDRIIALDKGHIVEEGTYAELMEKKGFFAELVERQQIR